MVPTCPRGRVDVGRRVPYNTGYSCFAFYGLIGLCGITIGSAFSLRGAVDPKGSLATQFAVSNPAHSMGEIIKQQTLIYIFKIADILL